MMPAQEILRSFRVEVEDGVALCLVDVPGESVNTLSRQVGAELTELLEALARDAAVKAIVIASGKKDGFVAGAKIDAIQAVRSAAEAEVLSRDAQVRFDALARSPKPVVAAIHAVPSTASSAIVPAISALRPRCSAALASAAMKRAT